jgi:hypothetical protein
LAAGRHDEHGSVSFQQGDDFVAIIELPGVSKSDLEIQAQENTIRIAGKKSISYDGRAVLENRQIQNRSATMVSKQEQQIQQKREVEKREEATVLPGYSCRPRTSTRRRTL